MNHSKVECESANAFIKSYMCPFTEETSGDGVCAFTEDTFGDGVCAFTEDTTGDRVCSFTEDTTGDGVCAFTEDTSGDGVCAFTEDTTGDGVCTYIKDTSGDLYMDTEPPTSVQSSAVMIYMKNTSVSDYAHLLQTLLVMGYISSSRRIC